ncbi:hypothetical protein [Flavobacterium sp.]|uniref:hypothetical protein n=1 Tax=Flavobacterium sp. TaxID=239 RepID=UPI00286B2D35|nr:hypothetical protein [Flavobacterium sp.]
METTTAKKDIIDWISSLDDEKLLTEIAKIKRNATFNFEEEFKKGISLEDARQRSIKKIRSYWKK